ncbi:MAG: PHP domain-containing protein [Rhodocyclaceae bacterium]|nr:PHP domain-containing protein [Rhodocyclaceae bacterium]
MPDRCAMWIDCHCHTKHSYDNWLEPIDLVRRARAIGLDGVVITEHHSYEASAPVEAAGREEGLLVLRGVEITTDRGHLLAYGVEDDSWNVWGRDTWLPLDEVIARINELGGICVPAHPYREFGVCSLLDGLLELQGIVAVETHNGGNIDSDNALAVTATRHLALPMLGGSDCHKVAAVGRCATEFTAAVTDMASFIAAVRAGACRADYFCGWR